ncbi:signal peptidase I [Paenibacillus darwinianus]|uniref:signal peptidase I n=1 Tax=Paenibacillus darwinianus TaxID=1380763 RepID=UPI000A79E4BE|nr:signal peptidase I [Paenibacillus darwinianus]
MDELLDWAKTLGVALVIVLLANRFVFNLSTVEGQSMEPTLEQHEWLFINKIGYRIGEPERGDIVILKDPSEQIDRKQFLVKRVIGLPGDTVEIRAGQLYVNGLQTVESYTDVNIEDSDYGPETIAEGQYFVMGDNRRAGASKDSRSFKPVPRALIKGEAQFILWPIAKMNKL